MGDRPWYKRYGADFVHGTLGLSLEEKGAYSLCLDLIYDRGGPIPDDPRWLAGVCGVSVRKWKSIRNRLIKTGKIVARDGVISNFRAEKEIEKLSKTSRKHAENGAKGGEKRAENEARSNENNDLGQAGLKHRARNQRLETRIEDSHTDVCESSAREWPHDAFDQFWQAYPHRVGKSAVSRWWGWNFPSADFSFEDLMSAVRRYSEHKPPDRQWCNPLTWLQDGRWADEPDTTPIRKTDGPTPAEQRSAPLRAATKRFLGRVNAAGDGAANEPVGEPLPDASGGSGLASSDGGLQPRALPTPTIKRVAGD